MQRLFCGLAALPFLASVALAGQPVTLNDPQLDGVTAGAAGTSGGLSFSPATPAPEPSYGLLLFFFNETDRTNTGTVIVNEIPGALLGVLFEQHRDRESGCTGGVRADLAQVTSADTRVLESWRIPPPVTAASRIPGLASGTPNLCGAVGATTYSIVSRV